MRFRFYFISIGLAFLFLAITRQSVIDAFINIEGENYFKEIGDALFNTMLCESHNLIAFVLGIHLVYIIKSEAPEIASFYQLPRKQKRLIFAIILFIMLYSLVIPIIKGSIYKLNYINSYYQGWYLYFTILIYGFCYFIGIKIILKYIIRYIEFTSLGDSFNLVMVLFSVRVFYYIILVGLNKIFEIEKIILI